MSTKRIGQTLIELVMAMSAATLLMISLSSALLISTRAFVGHPEARVRARTAAVQTAMLKDVRQATGFTTKTATSLTFTVPDRDGDTIEETISYEWDSGNDALNYIYNGSPSKTLLNDVTTFDLNYLTRSLTGSTPTPPPLDPNMWGTRWSTGGGIIFEEFTEKKVSAKKIDIDTPAGASAGDLLIAAVACDGNNTISPDVPGNWNVVTFDGGGSFVHFGVWWRIVGAGEPGKHRFNISGAGNETYGWLMRFTGHDPVNPIDVWASDTDTGNSASPPAPAVTTTVANTMILRLGGFDHNDILIDNPGLSGHTAITMDSSLGAVSGGAGYVIQPLAGDSGTSDFSLTSAEQWVTVTVAIAPDPG